MKLSIQHRKYLYWLVSILSTFIIGISIYQYLGGFEEIEVVKSSNNIYSIAGKEFKGSIKSEGLRNTFNEVRNYVNDGLLSGNMCVVNYEYSNYEGDEVHQFIGILLGDEISEIPPGFKVVELKSENTFKVGLSMHPLVMPNSEKVAEIIKDYAQERGYVLENYSMEILFPDNSVLVEMFAK